MDLTQTFNDVVKTAKTNSPEILTAASVTGVIATAYLTGKATVDAVRVIDQEELLADSRQQAIRNAKAVWKFYIPPMAAGVFTIVAIFGANRAHANRTAAAIAAYSLTERAFTEYREKVTDQIGKGKEQKVRDEIVEKHIANNPPKEVFLFTDGEVLCCDLMTQRYFKCSMEKLKQAENEVNHRALREHYVTVEDFYDILKVIPTNHSAHLGWTSDRLMELDITSVIAENGHPCLAFQFNYVMPL